MDLILKLVPLFAAALAATLGWLYATHGQWQKGTKDDDRIRKEVIFYLLELHHILLIMDEKQHMDLVLPYMKSKIPELSHDANIEAAITTMIRNQFLDSVKPILDSRFPKVRDGFSTAVAKLSSVDPILAFYLAGKEEIVNNGELIKRMLDSIKDDPENPAILEMKATTSQKLESTAFQHAHESITKLLLTISKSVGRKLFRSIQKRLAEAENKHRQIDSDTLQELDEFFAPLLSSLAGLANQALGEVI